MKHVARKVSMAFFADGELATHGETIVPDTRSLPHDFSHALANAQESIHVVNFPICHDAESCVWGILECGLTWNGHYFICITHGSLLTKCHIHFCTGGGCT